MLPTVKVTKQDGNTGVIRPGAKGVCAIIAPCSSGTQDTPSAHTKPSLAIAEFGNGALTEYASYVLNTTGNPVVLIRCSASTAGAYGTVSHAGEGTSVATATVGEPNDDYDIVVKFVTGGTIGVTGITYQCSLDGGLTFGPVLSLLTGTSIVVPTTNATLSLAAGTILAGQTESFSTTGPRATASDLTTALEALRVSSIGWEWLLVGAHDATASSITAIDTWLAAREAEGKYRGFTANTVMKGSTDEATYATNLATTYNGSATIRGCIAADGGACVSTSPGRGGYTAARPTALGFVARLMSIPYGEDAAFVKKGQVPGFQLPDEKGNPKFHDEALFPNLNGLRLVALRTFDGRQGTFINDPLVLSPNGSDFVYAQHVRTMNRACEIVFDVLTSELSRGVLVNPKSGPNGEVYIAEEEAQALDDLANMGLNELKAEVTDIRFKLARTDNIGSNGPATLSGDVWVNGKRYAKQFNINASFVRTISTQA